MAVTRQADGAIAASTGADVTPVIPTHATDDIMIAHVFYRSQTPTTATPAGWTLLEGPYDGNASTRHYWFWKRAAGSSETNPLMDKSAATGDTYARVHLIRGAWTGGNPFEDTQTTAHDTADPGTIAGVTSLTAGAGIFLMMGDAAATSTDQVITGTDPTTYSQDNAVSTTGSDGMMARGFNTRATAGDTGNINVNHNGSPAGGATLVVAIGETSSAVNVTITSVAATATAAAGVPTSVGGPESATVNSVAATATAAATTPVPVLTLTTPAATATAAAAAPTTSTFQDGAEFFIPGPPPAVVYVGTNKAVYAQFRDPDGVFYAPDTVSFKTRNPDGTMTSYVYGVSGSVVNDALGVYHLTFEVTNQGLWTVAAQGVDEDAVGQVTFPAQRSIFD